MHRLNEGTAGQGWTRRAFLRAAVVGTVLLAGRWVYPSEVFGREVAIRHLPEGRLTFVNLWTNERLDVTYRDEDGHYDPQALDAVNHILRCHYTGEVAAIDVRVIEHVNLVQKSLGGRREIHVVSGYRSPEHNAMLVRSGRRVAKHSLHMQGQAIDIRIPGVHPNVIRHTAMKLQYGGVGYYPRSKFVHLDSGPFRYW
ncbi:MAG: YcbK family protein [Nitrospira sp.]